MKIFQTSDGGFAKINKQEWLSIGKKAGWLKQSAISDKETNLVNNIFSQFDQMPEDERDSIGIEIIAYDLYSVLSDSKGSKRELFDFIVKKLHDRRLTSEQLFSDQQLMEMGLPRTDNDYSFEQDDEDTHFGSSNEGGVAMEDQVPHDSEKIPQPAKSKAKQGPFPKHEAPVPGIPQSDINAIPFMSRGDVRTTAQEMRNQIDQLLDQLRQKKITQEIAKSKINSLMHQLDELSLQEFGKFKIRITHTAEGSSYLRLTRSEWEGIGKKSGWI